MKRKMLVADLLCGAGGSSTGCERALTALGLDMELVCLNHWPVAIETHTKNHPKARHYVQDISTVRPHIIVPEGYLDLLMASPTCTHHSVARGGKPTSDQQRSDPWHIITWLTELRVKRAIIENVWEFTGWGPVDARTGKPIKSRKGEYFRAWVDTIWKLGATSIEWRKLNAADYGDATTRQRFIIMIRFDGKSLAWPAPTHRKREVGRLELFPGTKPWRPAREIIDWDLKGKSIFTRKKPLAAKTLARIEAGAVKFGWPEPFLVVLRNHMAGRTNMHGRKSPGARGSEDPLMTTTTDGGIAVAEAVIVNMKGKSTASGGAAAGEHPGCARPMLVQPFIATVAHGNDAHERSPNARRAKSIEEPLGTVHGDGSAYAVVAPFILSRHGDGAPRATDEPTPTQVAKHSHCLISPYYGSGSGDTCKSADAPLDTVTAKARFGMVVPITHTNGSNAARDVSDQPIPTITTAKGGEFAFVTAQHGEREGQAPRVHNIDDPSPTIAASGHVDLAEGVATAVTDGVHYDILFRMLEPHELAAAMGFTTEDQTYEFAGTKTEQIKQIGNAVSVRKMQACVGALMADAVPRGRRQQPASRAVAA